MTMQIAAALMLAAIGGLFAGFMAGFMMFAAKEGMGRPIPPFMPTDWYQSKEAAMRHKRKCGKGRK